MNKVRAYEINGEIVKDGTGWDAALGEAEEQLNGLHNCGIEWEDIEVNIKCVWVEE